MSTLSFLARSNRILTPSNIFYNMEIKGGCKHGRSKKEA
nr:MAG TPA: DNA-binding nuclear phosphoprotein p8 [Caudoviricetes sp.]